MAFISFRMFIRISLYKIHFSLSVYKQYSWEQKHYAQLEENEQKGMGNSIVETTKINFPDVCYSYLNIKTHSFCDHLFQIRGNNQSDIFLFGQPRHRGLGEECTASAFFRMRSRVRIPALPLFSQGTPVSSRRKRSAGRTMWNVKTLKSGSGDEGWTNRQANVARGREE